ncbi:MAG: hypothetical protein CM15mP74_18050 [Halieaceae bacterium]|nr:MAG: hypothetical protein CM15mP74_18050 [Halieaceae bacterium]
MLPAMGLGGRSLLAMVCRWDQCRPRTGLADLREAAGRRPINGHAYRIRYPPENLPMVMALLELWQTHYLGANTTLSCPMPRNWLTYLIFCSS